MRSSLCRRWADAQFFEFTGHLIEMGTVKDDDLAEFAKNLHSDKYGEPLSNFVVASISFIKEEYAGVTLPNPSIVYPKESTQPSHPKDEL